MQKTPTTVDSHLTRGLTTYEYKYKRYRIITSHRIARKGDEY